MTVADEKQLARYEREARAKRQAEQAARIDAAQSEARAALAMDRCPTCGGCVRRNLSITGWVQCTQYGAVTHRADPTRPSCPWQGFTQ